MGKPNAHDVPFTARDAAHFWGVTISAVYRWIERAQIEAVGYRREPHANPLVYRFGDLADAERRFRTSPRGRPRGTTTKRP